MKKSLTRSLQNKGQLEQKAEKVGENRWFSFRLSVGANDRRQNSGAVSSLGRNSRFISVARPAEKPRSHSQFTIARDLNISQPSVSNALTGKRHLCHSETYARVWAYAAAIGYRGRGMAIDIAPIEGGLRQVGVIFGGDPLQTRCDPGMCAVHWTIEKILASRGISLVSLGAANEPWRKIENFARGGLKRHALLVFGEITAEFAATLLERPRRLVTVGTAFPGVGPAVVNHDEQAADLLLSHLKNGGHEHVLWFGGGWAEETLKTKRRAVSHAAERHGVSVHPNIYGVRGNSREAGRQAARNLLARADRATLPATAIVCSDAWVARGAIEELARARVSVPDDLSVVAMEFSRATADETPVITSAGSDPEAMGRVVAEILTDCVPISAAYARTVHPPARLLLGKTSGAARETGSIRFGDPSSARLRKVRLRAPVLDNRQICAA